MYNPYVAAFAALTNSEARRFYADTAIEHSFLTVAVTGIAISRTIEAGQAFRQVHDSHIVPFTLLAISTVVEFFVTPEPIAVEASQLLLAGFTPVALLPETKPVNRVLVTPCTSSDRTLTVPAPKPVDSAMPEPYSDHSYKELQALCKARGLSPRGDRQRLVSRICADDIQNAPLAPRLQSRRVRGRSIE